MIRAAKASKKQYVAWLPWGGVGVTFTAAEEKRVIARARRRKISVEELIVRALRKWNRPKSAKDDAAISRAIDALGRIAR